MGKKFNIVATDPVWVRLTYERLPNFCNYCGRLGHGHKQCDDWLISKEQVENDGFLHGSWLKAGPQRNRDGVKQNVQNKPETKGSHVTTQATQLGQIVKQNSEISKPRMMDKQTVLRSKLAEMEDIGDGNNIRNVIASSVTDADLKCNKESKGRLRGKHGRNKTEQTAGKEFFL